MKAWSLAVLLLAAVLAEKALARPNAAEGDEDLQDDEPDDDEPSDVPAAKVELHSEPLLLTQAPGDTVWLPCEVVNANTVVWLKEPANSSAISLAINDQRLSFKDDPRLVFHKNHTLEIKNLQSGDASSYTCRADSLRVNHKISLLEPPRLVSAQPANQQVFLEKGQHSTLRCHFAGNPPPHVHWTSKGGSLANNKTHKGDHLQLSNVDAGHIGVYTCHARNGLGNATHSFNVAVNDGPLITTERDVVNTNLGERTELACVVHAYPVATVKWSYSAAPSAALHPDARREMLEENVPEEAGLSRRHVLRIDRVKEDDLGTYYCLAVNEKGTARRPIKLSGTPLPATLTHVEFVRNRPKLSWVVESLDPITKYELMYRPKDSSEWESVELPANGTQRNVYTLTYVLEDLKSEIKEYEATLKSRNSFGWSDTSQRYPFSTEVRSGGELPVVGEKSGAPVTRISFSLLLGAVVLLFTRS